MTEEILKTKIKAKSEILEMLKLEPVSIHLNFKDTKYIFSTGKSLLAFIKFFINIKTNKKLKKLNQKLNNL